MHSVRIGAPSSGAWLRHVAGLEATRAIANTGETITVELLDDSRCKEWNEFVERHSIGAIYQRVEWIAALEEAFQQIRGHIVCARMGPGGAIVGGLPVCEARSWLLGTRMVSVPFGSWCDPLCSQECTVAGLTAGAMRLLGADSVASFEFRPWDTAAEMGKLGFDVRELYRHHFIVLDRPLEVLKKACSRTCVRQWVSKAERQGVRMVAVNSASEFRAFYDLLSMVRRRHALPLIPERFFAALRRHLPATQSEWWLAVRDDRWIGALLVLKANRTFTLEYAGQCEEGRAVGANQLLYMRALERAVEAGYAKFSFGRTSIQNQALSEYKRHWGTTEVELPEYVVPRVDRLRAGYRRRRALYRFGRACLGHIPGPLQRWVGELCYRHWG